MRLIWSFLLNSSIVMFLLLLLDFSIFWWMLSIEFFIRFNITLLNCSLSLFSIIFSSLLAKVIFIELSNSWSNLIFSFINITKLFFWNTGFGILAKSENSFTNFSICLIWLLIIFKFSLKFSLSSSTSWIEYLLFNLSIVNCIGVSGFLISCAIFLAKLPQASCLSLRISFSCWFFNLSIIWLKFLFKISKSLSVLTSGTFVSKLPLPIEVDAKIKLFIDLKNLEENLIAIDIEINKSKDTTII